MRRGNHKEIRERIASSIGALRGSRNMSQVKLARETGIEKTRLNRILRAKTDITLREFLVLCSYFNLPAADLIPDDFEKGGAR